MVSPRGESLKQQGEAASTCWREEEKASQRRCCHNHLGSLGTIRVAAKGLGGGEDEDIRAEGAASVSSEAPRRRLGGTCNSMC